MKGSEEMKTATVTTRLCRHTGRVLSKTIRENEGEVKENMFYKPLIEIFYKDMKKKGLI